MCAALSSYVRACAARGVLLSGWRDGVCSECPPAGRGARAALSPRPRDPVGGLWGPRLPASSGLSAALPASTAKAMETCPKSLTYRYNISTCPPTCRARSDEGVTCGVGFVPVDGCTCPEDTFLDNTGACVPAASCPCYFQGSVVPNGESRHEQGTVW